MLNEAPLIDVLESFSAFYARSKNNPKEAMKVLRQAPMIELTIEEFHQSVFLEASTEHLLERLEIGEILASKNQEIGINQSIFPVSRELIYTYDFGDNWKIKITKYEDFEEVIERNIADHEEIEEAVQIVSEKRQPICLNANGLSVLDDIGNLRGFADFLGSIYEGTDKKEMSDLRGWAKSMGWNPTKKNVRKIL